MSFLFFNAEGFHLVVVMLGEFAALLTALTFIHKKIGVPMRAFIKRVHEAIFFIERELRKNGGSSIRDGIDRIDRTVSDISGSVDLLNQRQRAFFAWESDGLWEADAGGNFVWASRVLCTMLSCTPDQVLGKSWIGLIDAGDRERVAQEWAFAIRDQRDFRSTYRVRKSDTESLAVHAFAIRLVSEDGKLIGWFGRVHPARTEDLKGIEESGHFK